MARVEIPFVVNKASISIASTPTTASFVAAGASVAINIRGGSPATIYAAETGGTTLSNPVSTTSEGRIDGWLNEGSYTMTVSGSGITTYSQPIEMVRGDGVGFVAAGTIGTTQIIDGSVTAAKLATAVTGTFRPPGEITMFGGSAAPTGWLLCDGQTYDGTNATYMPLWNAIGATYGGIQSAFKVPDLRGRVPVGSGTGTATRATAKTRGSQPTSGAGGEETHVQSVAELVDHQHSPLGGYPYTMADDPSTGFYAPPAPGGTVGSKALSNQSYTGGVAAGSLNSPSNIQQPYSVVNFIIRL